MSIAASIVSVILKSIFEDKIRSGLTKDLIGISIDKISEKGINEIYDFINSGKSKIERILTKENMKSMNISEKNFDYVIAEIKDLISGIDITDEVYRQCQYDSMNLSAFLWNEYRKNKNNYIECESEIKRCLYAVADALIKLIHESNYFESKDFLIQISNSVDDANAELQNISDCMKENFGRLDADSKKLLEILQTILEQIQKINVKDHKSEAIIDESKKLQNNKKQEYIKNWNSRLFLHQDNNENPIKLADAFIMPDYIIHKYIDKIEFSDTDTFDQIIEKFVNYDRTSTLLITGVPGIGKSTITSWIANKYKEDDKIIILKFRDWKRVELEKTLLDAICSKLHCNTEDLEKMILILDGFDEMKALDIRDKLLNDFFADIKDYNNFKCIITSRSAYIDPGYFHNVFELKEFDIKRVDDFYRIITGNSLSKKEKIKSGLEIFGIPVILYMAIMSNVDICENHTKPELYNKIFAEEGGIFDKFYDGVSEYSLGAQLLRIHENTNMYLSFLRETAYKMFIKNDLFLSKKEYKIPKLPYQGKSVSVLEFPISHLFENTSGNIEFIHKSIYEYFVAEYIYVQIISRIEECEDKKSLAGEFSGLLKDNHLSEEICEFLKYKISQNNAVNIFDDIFDTFKIMICDGMTYHMVNRCKNVIECEMNVFANMLEIIHLWNIDIFEFDNAIFDYLKYSVKYELNLSNVNFSGKNLSQLLLANVNLNNAKLDSANLAGVDLRNTKFIGACIHEINLNGAIIDGAIFSESHIKYLKKKYNLHGVKVYCRANNTVINHR